MAISQLKVPIQRPSLVDSVYETLLEAIVSGQLAPGSELNSVMLAEQLDVSRTPVTEAIKLLAHDGVVEQINHRRARVAKFSREELTEIYEVRNVLESAAAELAAKNIETEVLDALESEAAQLQQSRGDVDWPARALDFDIRFHQAIASACGNKRLQKEIGHYRLLIRAFCRATSDEEILLTALTEHMAIIEALRTRKPAATRTAMSRHIANRLKSVLRAVFNEAVRVET